MNKSKIHLKEGQIVAKQTSQSLLHDYSLALDSSFPNASEVVGDKSSTEFAHMADLNRSKSKQKVNELGALGTLKNLSRILNQQESTLTAAKAGKSAGFEASAPNESGVQYQQQQHQQPPQPPQASLSSHQLHMKQKQLLRQGMHAVENSNGTAKVTQLHRPSNSSQLTTGVPKNARAGKFHGSTLDRSSISIKKLLNNTVSGPMLGLQSMQSQSQQTKKAENIDKLIRTNLRRQKEKEDKIQNDREVERIREKQRKAELAFQNQQVRQANKLKVLNQERRSKARQKRQQDPATKQSRHGFLGGAQKMADLTQSVDSLAPQPMGLSDNSDLRKIGSMERNAGKREHDEILSASQTGNTRLVTNLQRFSQERGQRVLSGASKGSRGGGSAKSGGSRVLSTNARSGRSGGQGLSSAQLYLQEQRGHALPNQTSAHAGDKKDSINSNLSHMNQQQSQGIMGNQHGEIGLQASQRLESSAFMGVLQQLEKHDEIQEHLSQEDSATQTDRQTQQRQKQTRDQQVATKGRNLAAERRHGKAHAQPIRDRNLDETPKGRADLVDGSALKHWKKSSLKGLAAEVHKVPYQNPQVTVHQHKEDGQFEEFSDLFLNRNTQSSANLRSQKQLSKGRWNANEGSLLALQNQTFSHKVAAKGAGVSDHMKNRKRSELHAASSSGMGGLGLLHLGSQQKSLAHQTISTHNNGLDFLDIKKEIKEELKEVEKKYMGQGQKKRPPTNGKGHDNTMIVLTDQNNSDLRNDRAQKSATSKWHKAESKEPNLSGSRTRDQPIQMQSHSGLPGMAHVNKRQRNKDSKAIATSHGGGSHLNLQHIFLNESSSVQQLNTQILDLQTTAAAQLVAQPSHKSKKQQKAIQKFIKAKKQEREHLIEQSKQEERSRMLKTQQNLSKLDCFVRKKFQNSLGHHQNASSTNVLDQHLLKNTIKDKHNHLVKQSSVAQRKDLDRTMPSGIELTRGLLAELQASLDERQLQGEGKAKLNRSSGQRPVVHQQSSTDFHQVFDLALAQRLKQVKQERQAKQSSRSTRHRGGRDRGSDHSFDEYALERKSQDKLQSLSGNQRNSDEIMRSINDIINRSKSQQRSEAPMLHHPTSPVLNSRRLNGPTNTLIANTTKNNKLKTIESKHTTDIEFFRKSKDRQKKQSKSKRQSFSQRTKPRTAKMHSYNAVRNVQLLNARNTSKSKSRSKSKSNKSRNQRVQSKKSNSKSRENKARSQKSQPGRSNSRSPASKKSRKESSKSKSVSLTRSTKADANYSRQQASIQQLARQAARLNEKLAQKLRKQRNSLSPRVPELMGSSHSLPDCKATRNHQVDQLHSDFDYNKFMHGTIKISPSGAKPAAQLARGNQVLNKSQLPPPRSTAGPRRRNRSQARQQSSGVHHQPLRVRAHNIIDKPKSQQNLLSADGLSMERSSSNLKSRQQSRHRAAAAVTTKDLQRTSNKAARKVQVQSQQIQEILRKINFDAQRKKVKKKQSRAKVTQPVKHTEQKYEASHGSCVNITGGTAVNQASPSQYDLSGNSLLAARKMLSPQLDQPRAQPNEGAAQRGEPRVASGNFPGVQTEAAQKQAAKGSERDKQRQLKELLKSIYKKNEQLIKQSVYKGAAAATETETQTGRFDEEAKSEKKLLSSSRHSSKLARYSEEKWVEVRPEHQPAACSNFKASGRQQPSAGSHVQPTTSHRYSDHSNNFTFYDKNAQNNSQSKQGDILPSQKSQRSNSTKARQAEEAKKLEKLYLNNLDIAEGLSYQSLRLQHNDQQLGQQRQGDKQLSTDEKIQSEVQRNQRFRNAELAEDQQVEEVEMNAFTAKQSVPGLASSRSVRSGRSGIMAQLNEIASSGGLRLDNEFYYQKMLEGTNQPPFTAIESHRSLTSSSRHCTEHPPGKNTGEVTAMQQQLKQTKFTPGQLLRHKSGQILKENQQQEEADRQETSEAAAPVPEDRTSSQFDSEQEFHKASEFQKMAKNVEEDLHDEQFYGQYSEEMSQVKSKERQVPQSRSRSKRPADSRQRLASQDQADSEPLRPVYKESNRQLLEDESRNLITLVKEASGQTSSEAEPEDEEIEVMLKISQINLEKDNESLSQPASGAPLITSARQRRGSESNASQRASKKQLGTLGSSSVAQSLISLNTPSSAKLAQAVQLLDHKEPITIDQHDDNIYDDSAFDRDPRGKSETQQEQTSPYQSHSLSVQDATNLHLADNNPATAENLIKYLETKWNEKKQESGSLFDGEIKSMHSRASLASEQKLQKGSSHLTSQSQTMFTALKAKPTKEGSQEVSAAKAEEAHKQEGKDEEQKQSSASESMVLDHSSIRIVLDNQAGLSPEPMYAHDMPPGGTQDSSRHPSAQLLTTEEEDQSEEPVQSKAQSQSAKSKDSLRSLPHRPAEAEQPLSEESPLKSSGSPELQKTDRQSNELDKYLDDDISEKSPAQLADRQPVKPQMVEMEEYALAKHQADQQARLNAAGRLPSEMAITSNLTTLNLDGDNSSSDGSAPQGAATVTMNMPPASMDEDSLQQLKDKQYLDQFRKRQNRLSSKEPDQQLEINQIEIEIQENSDPTSPALPQIQVKLESFPPGSKAHPEAQTQSEQLSQVLSEKPPGQNIKISEMLKQNESLNESEVVCQAVVLELVEQLYGKEALKSEPTTDKQESKQEAPEQHESKSKQQSEDFGKQAAIDKPVTTKDVYNFIANSINQTELKHQIKQIVEMKQRNNIENDLFQTDDYINELLQYLMQFELLTQHQLGGHGEDAELRAMLEELGGINYLVIFLRNLTQPIKRSLVDQLKQYRTQEQGSYEHFESVQDPLKHPILPIDIYLDVEKHREYEFQMSQRQDKGKAYSSNVRNYLSGHSASSVNTVSIIQESQHILNKSIFDAMNESLTKFRPYGIIGEPLPWSSKYRRLQTDVDINSVDTERLVQMVKQEIFRWMSIQQGHLLHPHDGVFQYIDLQIPLMPDLRKKIQEKEHEKDPKDDEKTKELDDQKDDLKEDLKNDKQEDKIDDSQDEEKPKESQVDSVEQMQDQSVAEPKPSEESAEAAPTEPVLDKVDEKDQGEDIEKIKAFVEEKKEKVKLKPKVEIKDGGGPKSKEQEMLSLPKADSNKNAQRKEKDEKDELPLDLKDFASAQDLVQLQETQFLKFKKNLIEDATQELRQSKLAAQLQHEILEDEHYWLNYEFEESQIRRDLSELVFQQLLEETVQFLDDREKK